MQDVAAFMFDSIQKSKVPALSLQSWVSYCSSGNSVLWTNSSKVGAPRVPLQLAASPHTSLSNVVAVMSKPEISMTKELDFCLDFCYLVP